MRKLVALTVVAALAIVAAGWFLLITPKNAEAADLRTQAADESSEHDALRRQIAMLTADEKNTTKYEKALADLRRHMPDELGQPSVIREIYKAADASGVGLTEVLPGAPIAGAVVITPEPTEKEDATSTASAKPSAKASTSAGAKPPARKAAVVPDVAVSQIPMSLTVTGTYVQVKEFLHRVANFRRAFLVASVNLSIAQPAAEATADGSDAPPPSYSGELTAVISGAVFSAGPPSLLGTVESATTSPRTASATASPAGANK